MEPCTAVSSAVWAVARRVYIFYFFCHLISVSVADGRFERIIIAAKRLDRLTCGKVCLTLRRIGFSTCVTLFPNVTKGRQHRLQKQMFIPFSRDFTENVWFQLQADLAVHNGEMNYSHHLTRLMRVEINHGNTFRDFVLGDEMCPTNLEKWVVLFGIGHSRRRNIHATEVSVPLFLLYAGKGVHRGKLLPE